MKLIALVFCAFAFLTSVLTYNGSIYKTCKQSSFCRRCRKVEHNNSSFELLPATLNTHSDSIKVHLLNKNNGHIFLLKVEGVQGDIFRITIDEKTPLRHRYRVSDALKGPLKPDVRIKVTESKTDIIITCGQNKAVIHATPFKIDFYRNEMLFVSANAKGLFKFEHYRTKANKSNDDVDNEPGTWEEDFNSFHDSKPNGPEAVAMDFTFPQAGVLFGIPEHADSFALKSTSGGDPYRLYNLDVGEFELDNGMALYGSVPVIYGHGTKGTAGVFWMNAAETWVDIYNQDLQKNVSSSGSAAHFMSESGIVDAFILLGETPQNTFKQYTDLTGVAPLPQQAALAFHQSRWNYNDEKDVLNVSKHFDIHDIPMDTMWLDIEYTEEKKYFTWDPQTFPHPLEMIGNLTESGRHLTIIIDPHIKTANNYHVHDDCTKYGYYTKNKDGHDFEGVCWPGNSSYADFFNPVVRKYFADQYLLENFNTTTNDVFIWNDMNEPSVFSGPELTMPKDNLHNTEMGTFEHRAVHNLYGFMQTKATFDGLYRRGNGKYRPFILTRSHFAGSQRYAAIWTGDNTGDWGYLQMSLKTCLTQAVSGFSFCGSDVGGFFKDPSADLFERWHQAGAFQPFFRAHANMSTKRREPWLFPEDSKLVVRDAIRKRYTYLPFWYVMFYEHERFGYPVMRPLLSHYPHDPETFAIDNQYLLADRLLVHPVAQEGATKVDVYFPRHSATGDGDLWYDIDDYTVYDSVGYVSIPVNRNKIPVFQRGGTIVPKKEHVRQASTLMKNDPYTLIVCLDRYQEANGTLYADDEQSFEYRNGKYIYVQIEFKKNVLSSKRIDPSAKFDTQVSIERVVITGLDKAPQSATLSTSSNNVALEVIKNENSYSISKATVNIADEWKIILNY
ncbi:neutral alpha-glucosidase AB-like isoform X1 [Contarinia nasturtii]|uniref:neutral alpha-glucosidase AB-like isoform X1 n=1 Tax=Contarinia nasturtii TaxID=265458 RepID=UPI0012D3C3EA|nr:neutral alpha-glucosidase AB-like isoform X1 [Contarinia nasturtii]